MRIDACKQHRHIGLSCSRNGLKINKNATSNKVFKLLFTLLRIRMERWKRIALFWSRKCLANWVEVTSSSHVECLLIDWQLCWWVECNWRVSTLRLFSAPHVISQSDSDYFIILLNYAIGICIFNLGPLTWILFIRSHKITVDCCLQMLIDESIKCAMFCDGELWASFIKFNDFPIAINNLQFALTETIYKCSHLQRKRFCVSSFSCVLSHLMLCKASIRWYTFAIVSRRISNTNGTQYASRNVH